MKNYVINFIKDDPIAITAEQAAKIAIQWQQGASVLMINGSLRATHQITSIQRTDRQTEKYLCEINDIDPEKPPLMENFLSDKKLLK